MIERLFTETFFKKNDYFKNKLNISKNDLKSIKNSIENWKMNCENFNPDLDKETTDENEFINTVFKDILGYVGKGTNSQNYNIYPKFKIDNAGVSGGTGYADLALGYFTRQKEKINEAQVLIEFKDMNSDDLDKPSTRKDKLSPVNQCWNYLDFYGKAKWGIVTNFNEIRIYYKNKGKRFYEVFYFIVPEEYKDKFKPLTEDTEIYKFITILKFNHFLSDPNVNQQDSFTEEILASQGAAEEKVKKKFYLEYKTLRSEVFYHLLEINPFYQTNKSRLLELVQKLLDRIIFCWFCEDSRAGLLPINVLSKEIIEVEIQGKYYSDKDDDIYSKVRKLFKAIDVGGNFNIAEGYNGELFKEDNELDSLKIPNFLFKKISEIGLKYDFGDENELNVNTLGHIFEQSISDLEEMRVRFQEYSQGAVTSTKQQVLGFDNEIEVIEHKHQKFDPKKTKRKKEGVYYTPDYITKYIVENTVGEWLKEKWQATNLKFSNIKKNKEYVTLQHYRDEYLSKIKILDPACGSGAFLVAAFDYLWSEHERIYKQIKEIKTKTAQGELFDFDLINKTILENNLYGVDLNRESVEITKLSLWLKTAVKNKKLNNLENNIKVGNSLIDDPSVAGDLAFNWVEEFVEVFESKRKINPAILVAYAKTKKAGFDIVLGNPPYVRADVDNSNYQRQRKWMENSGKYKTLYEKWDLYIAFLERGLYLLYKGGILSFIISNSYNTVKYSEKSRNFIFENYDLQQIDFFENVQVFEGIGVESVILKIRN
ncbi:MAG: Eco57I restriction-modification methylase domain-containing protein, partial [Leptospiraceae bacterium]|nr:Eco57I restriction-modification methylase domain-containing protein [Leptospiraceae bacterium]